MDVYDLIEKYPNILEDKSINVTRDDILSMIEYYIEKDITTIDNKINLLYHNMICYKNYSDMNQYQLREQSMYYLIEILALLENNILKDRINLDAILKDVKSNINDKEVTSVELDENAIYNFFTKYNRGGAF